MTADNFNSVTARISLVTGATRGIGEAIAKSLGAQGHTVIGTATSQPGGRIESIDAQA